MVPLGLGNKLSTMTQLIQNDSPKLQVVKEKQPLPVIAITKKPAKVILSKKVSDALAMIKANNILEEASESLIEDPKEEIMLASFDKRVQKKSRSDIMMKSDEQSVELVLSHSDNGSEPMTALKPV